MKPPDPRLPAIVLAAGASTRLGRPKQLESFYGEPLLERAVRLACEAGCAPVVVLGSSAERILAECSMPGAQIVLNPEWAGGMASSLRAGLQALASGAAGTLVLTCDQPAVSVGHLRTLAVQGLEAGRIVASAYAGRRGVPAYFPAGDFPELLQLEGDTGARELLYSAVFVELLGGELDVDTEGALEQARRLRPIDVP